MHDINGKQLQIGDNVFSPAYGMLIIKEVKAEHDTDKGGALIECIGVARGGQGIELRTHDAKVTKVRTWKELAVLALQVQDASNLSGVVGSFSQIISEVRVRLESEGKGGTDNVNMHPVCRLFADKVAHLTGTQSIGNDEVSLAYRWAYTLKEEADKLLTGKSEPKLLTSGQ